jgi:hypothetical protein
MNNLQKSAQFARKNVKLWMNNDPSRPWESNPVNRNGAGPEAARVLQES